MEITDFNELNALYRLLTQIKCSDKFDSEDIDTFAGSPFITELLRRVKDEYIPELKRQHPGDHIVNWEKSLNFKVDSEMGKAIINRINNWDKSTVDHLAVQSQNLYAEIAKEYISPFDFEQSELDKLVDYIEQRVKNASV